MRILVTGDRRWSCYELAKGVVRRLIARFGPGVTIVHSGAPGVDQSFQRACVELQIPVEPHVADWQGLGDAAGPVRNQKMVDSGVQMCVAFHRAIENSRGTKDCVRRALALGIPTCLISSQEARPERLKAALG
jgi:hypothetical protein